MSHHPSVPGSDEGQPTQRDPGCAAAPSEVEAIQKEPNEQQQVLDIKDNQQNHSHPKTNDANNDKPQPKKQQRPKRTKQLAARARHRLLSIRLDALHLQRMLQRHHQHEDGSLSLLGKKRHLSAVVANERCGSWYTATMTTTTTTTTTNETTTTVNIMDDNHDQSSNKNNTTPLQTMKTASCYFKSTDGHAGTWNMSLKRLNLNILDLFVSSSSSSSSSSPPPSNGNKDDLGYDENHTKTNNNNTASNVVVIVDSSMRKILPDALSRTIPIWACVLNRIAAVYRQENLDNDDNDNDNNNTPNEDATPTFWDTNLYVPSELVSEEERQEIESVLDERVECLYQSKAIVNPKQFLERMDKPLRPIWMSNTSSSTMATATNEAAANPPTEPWSDWVGLQPDEADNYNLIACWNPSRYKTLKSHKGQFQWISNNDTIGTDKGRSNNNDTDSGYYYTPGAADDHESWARGLSPQVFWKHCQQILADDEDDNDDQVDARIDVIVRQEILTQQPQQPPNAEQTSPSSTDDDIDEKEGSADRIGNTSLWVGSRRAGRPPSCWKRFEAVLNVTEQEYTDMMTTRATDRSSKGNCSADDDGVQNQVQSRDRDSYYLQLPVAEGKRDKTELERWMPVGLSFLILHLKAGRRVLVHCAQGKDRSVGVVLALVMIACRPLVFPLQLCFTRSHLLDDEDGDMDENNTIQTARDSGWNVESMLQAAGMPEEEQDRNADSSYMHSGLSDTLVKRLLLDNGRELFLQWVHEQLGVNVKHGTLADKKTLRIAMHLVRQDRELADPTRSTFQKLNRFFMSSPLYRG